MSLHISRTVLRQSMKAPARAARRFESTSTKATEAAKDTAAKASEKASDFQSKASEGLSRVTSSAGPAISGAAKNLGNALGKVGGRTGRLIAFIERKFHLASVCRDASKVVLQYNGLFCAHRTNPTNRLLCSCWIRALQISYSRPKDGTSVSSTMQCLFYYGILS